MKKDLSAIQPYRLLIFLVASIFTLIVCPTIQGLLENLIIKHREEKKIDEPPSYSDLEGRFVVMDNDFYNTTVVINAGSKGVGTGQAIAWVVDNQVVGRINNGVLVRGIIVGIVVGRDGIVVGIGGDDEPHWNKTASLQNKSAKELLDKIATMCDTTIKDLLDTALDELHTSLSYADKYGETYYLLGFTYLKYGDYYTSIGNIPKAIDAYHRDSLDNFEKADRYNYYPYTNISYDKGRVYSSLGAIYQNNKASLAKEYFKKAIEIYNFCLEHNYKHTENVYSARSDAYYNLGLIHFEDEDYESAVQCYKFSIEDKSENYPAQYELGRSYFYQKKWTQSIEQFDFIIEYCPNRSFQELAIEGHYYAYIYKDRQ